MVTFHLVQLMLIGSLFLSLFTFASFTTVPETFHFLSSPASNQYDTFISFQFWYNVHWIITRSLFQNVARVMIALPLILPLPSGVAFSPSFFSSPHHFLWPSQQQMVFRDGNWWICQ